LSADWNLLTSQWDYYWKEQYLYNNAYAYNDLVLPNLYLGDYEYYWMMDYNPFSHMLTEYEEYVNENDIWALSSKSKYFYSPIQISNVEISETGLLKVFPNPASDALTFRYTGPEQELNLKMFDSQGKSYIDKIFSNTININTSVVPNGLYFYRISGNGNILESGKIIIKH
ncbi:MAG: T9SS type A sorting domain-containing protein, partial [Prolixibacteraceae bacterium]|nr:T9SS type A sorting domain-containing protein [Prolixibacteraceae bacterium]